MRNLPKKCDICNKKVKDGHLSRHRTSCLRKWERRDRATCLYCKQHFARGQNLQRHLRTNACGAKEYIERRNASLEPMEVPIFTPSKHCKKAPQFKKTPDLHSKKLHRSENATMGTSQTISARN